ncbi:hypothetical protein CRG98_010210 [Punica granatum]|uniref:Uncharacterized protein n=1 Tax=Punica granatum TaxID=22663 RepID=A0A2I0KLM1_PUNGR|nr:hypothetical protein CRG98_010210 [Punica granatum]
MAGALETLSGQAYGAQQYYKFGVQIYTGILSLILICTPLPLLWVFRGRPPVLLGQDPEISHEASKFMVCLILALFAYATLQPIAQYFQTQSFVMPMLFCNHLNHVHNTGLNRCCSKHACIKRTWCWEPSSSSNRSRCGQGLWVARYWGIHQLGACYLFRIPVAALLGFRVDIHGKGLWPGMMANKGKGGDISGKTSG